MLSHQLQEQLPNTHPTSNFQNVSPGFKGSAPSINCNLLSSRKLEDPCFLRSLNHMVCLHTSDSCHPHERFAVCAPSLMRLSLPTASHRLPPAYSVPPSLPAGSQILSERPAPAPQHERTGAHQPSAAASRTRNTQVKRSAAETTSHAAVSSFRHVPAACWVRGTSRPAGGAPAPGACPALPPSRPHPPWPASRSHDDSLKHTRQQCIVFEEPA